MNKKQRKKKQDVFVTRGSFMNFVRIYPATVGIRKFHGCVAWGAAWCDEHSSVQLTRRGIKVSETIHAEGCRARFGFFPQSGTAWLIEYNAKGKMKKSKVEIDFSD